MTRSLLALLLALSSPLVPAAVTGQALTPANTNVAGGESRAYTVRFFNSFGQPAAGETVQFSNDACGVFPNGTFFQNVVTDVAGVASIDFTAVNPGIVCHVVAVAGARVTFKVLTYMPQLVYFNTTLIPSRPAPGQAYTLRARAKFGAYDLYDVDVSAAVVPGSASATVSAGTLGTGDLGYADFSVTPDSRVGDYDVELAFRSRTRRVQMRSPQSPWQDMWWAGIAENGWGLSVVQHGEALFTVIYAYDNAGKPTWYVMSGGEWNAARTAYSGALYVPTGAPYTAYDASKFVVGAPVGSATLSVVDGSHLVLDYVIGAVAGRKLITRNFFGPDEPALTEAQYGDMWWGGAAQNGWGIALLQQYRTLFGVWFTYDAQGAPTWFVMPSGAWADAQTYQGRIYRASGSSWLGTAYDPAAFRTVDVGSFRARFAPDGATFEYTIGERTGTMPLSRTPF